MVTQANMLATPNLWNSLGNSVGEVTSMEDAMIKSGMDYNIRKVPLYKADGTLIPHRWGIEREDTGAIFDIVKDVWRPLYNRSAFSFFNPLLQDETISIDKVGCLRGGQKLFILAKINEPPMEIVKGDIVNRFILLLNSHDSKASIRVGFIPVRFVCLNQLPSIMRKEATSIVKIRHCGDPAVSLENLREIMNITTAGFEATKEQLQFLASRPINSKDLEKYVKEVFSIDEETKMSTRAQNIFESIIRLAETGKGNQIDGVRGTYYAAMNGVNEYLNHYAGRNVNTKAESLWLGKNATLNDKAMSVALEMAS